MFKFFKKLNINKTWSDEYEEQEWLIHQWKNPGFKSYIYMRDVTILKGIAVAIDKRDFHTALELSGRRKEILKMADLARKMCAKED